MKAYATSSSSWHHARSWYTPFHTATIPAHDAAKAGSAAMSIRGSSWLAQHQSIHQKISMSGAEDNPLVAIATVDVTASTYSPTPMATSSVHARLNHLAYSISALALE